MVFLWWFPIRKRSQAPAAGRSCRLRSRASQRSWWKLRVRPIATRFGMILWWVQGLQGTSIFQFRIDSCSIMSRTLLPFYSLLCFWISVGQTRIPSGVIVKPFAEGLYRQVLWIAAWQVGEHLELPFEGDRLVPPSTIYVRFPSNQAISRRTTEWILKETQSLCNSIHEFETTPYLHALWKTKIQRQVNKKSTKDSNGDASCLSNGKGCGIRHKGPESLAHQMVPIQWSRNEPMCCRCTSECWGHL